MLTAVRKIGNLTTLTDFQPISFQHLFHPQFQRCRYSDTFLYQNGQLRAVFLGLPNREYLSISLPASQMMLLWFASLPTILLSLWLKTPPPPSPPKPLLTFCGIWGRESKYIYVYESLSLPKGLYPVVEGKSKGSGHKQRKKKVQLLAVRKDKLARREMSSWKLFWKKMNE